MGIYDYGGSRGANQNFNYYDGALPYNKNLTNENYGKSLAGSVGHFDPRHMMLPSNLSRDLGASTYQASPPKEEIINEDIRLDVGNNLPITPNVPRPGSFYGIPGGVMDIARRLKGGSYYNTKFPSREFTEGDKTYTQKSLGGYYHPDEVFNMQEFGGVGSSDPRKDQFGKNIVSMAGDYEEGIEDWVDKYGTRKSTDPGFLRKQLLKNRQWKKIQERRQGIEDANRAASNQHLARQGITHSGPGGGGAFIDPGGRDRGGQGAFRENVAQMRGAGRSYTDAQGNVGYSSGRAEGGRIGYANRGFVDPEEPAEDIREIMQDQNIPMSEQVEGDPFQMRIQELMGKGLSWEDAYDIAEMEFQDLFAEGSEQDQGIASLV